MRFCFSAFLAIALAGACGDNFSSGGEGGDAPMQCDADVSQPCHQDGWVCANGGQTCSLNGDGTAYMCFNPGPKAEGETCTLYYGVPECDTNLFCLQRQGMTTGVCRQWCSPTDPCKACPEGQVCATVSDTSVGVTLNLCEVPP